MPDIQITNCHAHTLTRRHKPKYYPHPLVAVLFIAPFLLNVLAAVLAVIGLPRQEERVRRLRRFLDEGDSWEQEEIFQRMAGYYPKHTRFVVLSLDLEDIGHGPVAVPYPAQNDELAALRDRVSEGKVGEGMSFEILPFVHVRPDRAGSVDEMRRTVETMGFRGIKLYPSLGHPPDHPVLMNQVYPYACDNDLPVMTHCSRGGVWARGMTQSAGYKLLEPKAYVPVLERFPDLRLCLGHFGGEADWRAYAQGRGGDDNWMVQIRRMITGHEDEITGAVTKRHDNLWTDISYTLFQFDEFIPFLRVFLTAETDEAEFLRKRVLFGSDFYMTRQKGLTEREVCFRLRNALGDALFRQIAEENPARWLGEAAG